MSDYDETNRGTLFKNDMEGRSENFPPYGGSINIDGKDYWLSAWVKDGKSGNKFFSLAVKPKEPKPEVVQKARQEAFRDDSIDSIPF